MRPIPVPSRFTPYISLEGECHDPFTWGLIFTVALIPDAIIGWLVGKIPVPTLLCSALLTGCLALLGLMASKMIFNHPDLSSHYHPENLVMFLPPIVLAMLLGLWISRARKRPPARPWYLPPENAK